MNYSILLLSCLILRASASLTIMDSEEFDYDDDLEYHRSVRRPLRLPTTTSSTASPQSQVLDVGSRYMRLPKKKQMESEFLMRLLGDDFKPQWMAVDKPSPETESKFDSLLPRGWVSDRLLQQLHALNFTEELTHLVTDTVSEEALRSWLLKRASCPVAFLWEDIGPLFWPRWLRKGDCVDKHGACSWPPGMHCVPASSTTVYVLRWHCRNRKGRSRGRKLSSGEVIIRNRRWTSPNDAEKARRRLKCEWVRVPFPITVECFCTC